MTERKWNLSKGVFDPLIVNELSQAFEKAQALVDRAAPRGTPKIAAAELARFILAEARAGETQPDLVARVAAGKTLLAWYTRASKAARERDDRVATHSFRRQSMPRAGAPICPRSSPRWHAPN